MYNKGSGPFGKCVRLLDADTISVWRDKCAQKMCQYEHDSALKEEAKCASYSEMNDFCVELGRSLNQTWEFNWRNGDWTQSGELDIDVKIEKMLVSRSVKQFYKKWSKINLNLTKFFFFVALYRETNLTQHVQFIGHITLNFF